MKIPSWSFSSPSTRRNELIHTKLENDLDPRSRAGHAGPWLDIKRLHRETFLWIEDQYNTKRRIYSWDV